MENAQMFVLRTSAQKCMPLISEVKMKNGCNRSMGKEPLHAGPAVSEFPHERTIPAISLPARLLQVRFQAQRGVDSFSGSFEAWQELGNHFRGSGAREVCRDVHGRDNLPIPVDERDSE
jgi:hypothetical protein